MNSQEIAAAIEQKHQALFDWLDQQSDEQWTQGPDGKWTVGQHVLHLVNSLKMLNKALMLPKFMIRYKFGTSNRPSRTYQEVAQRYQQKLDDNRERARSFNADLEVPGIERRRSLLNSLQIQQKKLQFKTRKMRDKHFDKLLLPHPLMGRMTLREIIMWTAYHTDHHYQILKDNY